ncbi:MAG TPA: copper resistance protein CopC, partial [Candidatus Binatia bacterium]|nr:copper resistance protein CopC [Candidatus Binatia bacterium]
VGATLFAAGLLLSVPRRVPAVVANAGGDGARSGWPWPSLLGLSLVVLPVVACARAAELVPLWREIAELLGRVGFWEEIASGSQFSGLVMLPILVALFVPSLETAAALLLIAPPPVLLVLLMTRSRRFPEIFAMLVVCQAGLVVSSLFAADAFSRVATEAITAMTAADDVEVHRAAEVLRGAQQTLATTASALVVPMLGYLAWLPLLLRTRSVDGFFTAGDASIDTVARPVSSLVGAAARPGPSVATSSAPRSERAPGVVTARASRRGVGLVLVTLGTFVIAFGALESLRPRARYVSSDPAPGTAIASSPAIARVTFDDALDPSSMLSVTRMATGSDGRNDATVVTRTGGLDTNDSAHKTLKAELSGIPDGLYHASWTAAPAAGGVVRHGSFYFGVGAAGAESVPGSEPVAERDSGERRRRRAFAGGVLVLGLGVVTLVARRAGTPEIAARGG